MLIFVEARTPSGNSARRSKGNKKRRKPTTVGEPITKDPMAQEVPSSCFPFAVGCRLTKTFFGIPRKCSQCHKVIILNAGFACQFCRYRCHKKCVPEKTEGSTGRLSACSLSRLPSGDDQLLNKLLKENDINSNDVWGEDNWASLLSATPSLTTASPRIRVNSDTGIGYCRPEMDLFPHSSLSSPRLVTDRLSSTSSETLTSSLPRSPIALDIVPPDDEQVKDKMFNRLLSLLWWRSPLPRDDISDRKRSRPESLVFGGSSRVCSSAASPVRTPVDEFNYSLLEELFQQRSSASSTNSGPPIPPNSSRRLTWLRHFIGETPTQSQDCVTHACPLTLQPHSVSQSHSPGIRLSSSWPLMGLHMNHEENIMELEEDAYGSSEADSLTIAQSEHKCHDVTEWDVNVEDIVFGDCISQGRLYQSYNGRWYGEATIHKFTGVDETSFLSDVQRLARIRHENISLFMGACTRSPLRAVIMSCQKGVSLHHTLHRSHTKLSHQAKVNIAKQIAQGMGYLHAKGVVMKCLSSECVFLENKVKLCILDHGGPAVNHSLPCAVVRRGQLTYWSPELITHMIVTPPSIHFTTAQTKASDLFAYGTILYELLAGCYPLEDLCAQSVILRLGRGQTAPLQDLTWHPTLKDIVQKLWSPSPSLRPSFTTILLQLQQTAALHKKHSSSEPRLSFS